MIKIEAKHDMQEYLDLLSSSLEIYIDRDRLSEAFEDAAYVTDDQKWLTLLQLRIESGGLYSTVNPDNIIDYLWRIGVDVDKKCSNKRTGSLSLDRKRVVEPLIESGIAVDVLTAYVKYRSYMSYTNSLRKLLEKQVIHHTTDTGRLVLKYNTHVDEQDNLRAYYSDIAVVSIPKRYSSIITSKDEHHFLAWCDYPQADWRFAYNMFIRDAQNEQVMRGCEDAYEGLARLVEGDDFDFEKFKTTRKEFKVNCLSVFYNSANNAAIPTAIRKFFRSCPKYRKMLYDLEVLYQFRVPIPCESYFGYMQLLPEATYSAAMVSKGLNTPIQTFTSHVVNETVFAVLEKFWELGYTKDDINVYYVRHDEPIFMVSPSVIKDAWVFKECSEIYIPGFTPIHLDFHFGNYYQEEDNRLTEEINRNIANSDHRYDVFDDKDYIDEIHDDYNPLPTVERVHAQFYRREDGGIEVKFYNYRTMERKVFVACENDLRREAAEYGVIETTQTAQGALDDALHIVMRVGALEWLGNPKYLLVQTNGLSFVDHVGENEETFMKVIDRYDSSVADR